MTTTILSDLAVLLCKISHEVDSAEIDGRLKDVYSTLEPTIAEFKRLGAKARLHDIPDTLWSSLTQTITTVMTLCEQRGLEKERQVWASKWHSFKQSYEKGKAALAEERKRGSSLRAEIDTLRDQLKGLQAAGSSMSESRKMADEEHLARHMQHLSAANEDKIKAIAEIEKLKASEQIAELKLTMVSKERDDALKQVEGLQSQLAAKDAEMADIRGRVTSDSKQAAMAQSDTEARLARMNNDMQAMQSKMSSKDSEVQDLQSRLERSKELQASMAKELEETQEKARKLLASVEDLSSREPQYQQFRRSPHDLSVAPLGHVQQLHSNIHSPSTGTPPSLLHSIQHTPPSHAYPMQHTPPPHLQANNHYQSSSPRHGSYHQSSPRHSAYHGSPPLHGTYYQSASPNHGYHQSPPPGVNQGPPYGPPHGHPSRPLPRPRTNGRDGTSRPQTAHNVANQPRQRSLEEHFPDEHSPYDDQPGLQHARPVSKGVRWPENLPGTPVMTMNRGAKSEKERPGTSHSDVISLADPVPAKPSASPTKDSTSASKPGTSPVKATPTKYGTLKRKLKGMRRPPYGNMTGFSGGTVTDEAMLRLDHPLVSWDGPCFGSGSGPGTGAVPVFADTELEAMKQALSPHLVALMWSKSCRRALRRRPQWPRGVKYELLKPLQFEKTKKMKLAEGVGGAVLPSWAVRAKIGDRKPLGVLASPVQIQVR
ncbi:hypothetical protein CJU90_3536 [Yarrowia sp. C11]|nr:hypothetical protein CJU90_3536 [Yarrowia sp. C11]